MPRLRDIVTALELELPRARERVAFRDSDRKVVLYELKRANTAFRHSDQRKWTAVTLTIIVIKAEALGEHGNEAVNIVETFIKNPGVDGDRVEA